MRLGPCGPGDRRRVGLHANRFPQLPATHRSDADALRAAPIRPAARSDVLVPPIADSRSRPTRFWPAATVNLNDPPVRVAGMVNVMLDLKGRLHFLQAVPARLQESGAPPPAPDWTALLREAGFDARDVHPGHAHMGAASLWRRARGVDGRVSGSAGHPDPRRGRRLARHAGLLPDLRAVERHHAWRGRRGPQRITAGAVLAFPALLRRSSPARSCSRGATSASTAATRSARSGSHWSCA